MYFALSAPPPRHLFGAGQQEQDSMALTRLFVVVLAAALVLLSFSAAADAGGVVGVSYGRLGNNLPDTASVVQLLKKSGITSVRLYDANAKVLRALANTGITVMVMLPNDDLAAVAAYPSNARQWVQRNVAAYYPATRIHAVAVGNEVFEEAKNLTRQLVPAMANVHDALVRLGLDRAVKVSTPVAFTALKASWPPSAGRFRDDVAESVMKPMVDFLGRTGSYLTVNAYPFFAYAQEPDKISLDYALGNSKAGVRDPATGLVYHSLLDAQLDAAYFAMEKLGTSRSSSAQEGNGNPMARNGVPGVYVSESGWPSGGRLRHGVGRRLELEQRQAGIEAATAAASVANAQAYNNYLVNRVVSGDTGTPYRPGADMDVYVFALFNENQKGEGADDVEQHFGLFYPNQTTVYEFDFRGGGGALPSWCVADASVGDARLQAALDYACGHGADCGAIQPGAPCFEPNTRLAHASYAFNSYYQRNGRAKGACDFNGAAYVVCHEPAGTCDPGVSWCVANAAVGDARLLEALNYACANGADCGAIQAGGACFEPDTIAAHASYAFNSYYQRKGRASGTCGFDGAASVVYHAPKIGNCVLPSNSWIQETTPKSEAYSYAAF